MKVILPLGKSVTGVIVDVAAWLETKGQKIDSILLVAAPNDTLPTPPALANIAPVERMEVTPKGDFYPEPINVQGAIVVMNGGGTLQQWAIAKWWWQRLYNHGTSCQWESYQAPISGRWDAVAINVQRDGVQELACA